MNQSQAWDKRAEVSVQSRGSGEVASPPGDSWVISVSHVMQQTRVAGCGLLKCLCLCEPGTSEKWCSCVSEKPRDCMGTGFNASPYVALCLVNWMLF